MRAMVATVESPAADVVRRLGDEFGEIEPLEPGRCRLTSAADTLDWLAFRLLQLDADFEVHEPPELREHLARLGSRLRRASRAPGTV